MTDWEYFKNPRALQVFLYLLLKACYQETVIEGVTLQAGQVLTSERKMAKDLGMALMTLDYYLKLFCKNNFIVQTFVHSKSVITICKYESYGNGKSGDSYRYSYTFKENFPHTPLKEINTKKDLFVPNQKNFSNFVKKYNDMMKGTNTTPVKYMTETRKKSVANLYDKYGWDKMRQVIEKAARSNILNEHGVNFNWLFKEDNFVSVLEGNFDNK
jgi:hypothetical protein